MSEEHILMISTALSILLFVASIIWCGVRTAIHRSVPERCNKPGVSTTVIFSVFLIGAVGCLRFAIGFHTVSSSSTKMTGLMVWEEMVGGFLDALRTVSLEEEYAAFVTDIKALIEEVVPADSRMLPFCRIAMVIYASVLNILAPIMGGAVVLEVLASVFPKIRLRFSYWIIWRPKYFFGELNQASLALAKSIRMTKKGENPVLVFTDTYVDDEKEKENELLLEAKQYGAICIRDDVAHIAKPWFGKREYYLMNENEFENIRTLMALTEKRNIRALRKSCTYLFVQTDAYVQIEKQIKQKLQNHPQKRLFKGSKKPVIIPVNGYRNLVHNLFGDVPLYEPLVCKQDPTSLNVTILGNGSVGTEAFLCTYWLGQMLISGVADGEKTMTECKLTVNVVSKDPEEVFWSKIDYINPEIKETVEVLGENGKPASDERLRCNNPDGKNKAYCKVQYSKADVKIGGFWAKQDGEPDRLLDSDYIIVALGNDADNISVAEKIRRAVGKKHLEEVQKGAVKNVIIAYAVFNPKLAGILNEHKRYQTRSGKTDIYMHAFGSLDEVYSCDNVYMSKHSLMAKETGNAYLKLKQKSIEDNECRFAKEENGNYDYWANLARAAHIKYKVFSLGWINKSVFSYDKDQVKVIAGKRSHGYKCCELIADKAKNPYKEVSADCYHREYIQNICKQYKRLAIANSVEEMDYIAQRRKADLELKKHCLAWLEHRRWNAFTRTMGYRHTEVNNILAVKGSQKDMPMKLHACLVEAKCPDCKPNETYIHAKFLENGKIDHATVFADYPKARLDPLDQVSLARKKHKSQEDVDDFKTYDYYRYEFDDYLRPKELLKYVPGRENRLVRLCKRGKLEGAFLYPVANECHIPVEAIKRTFGKRYRQLKKTDPDDAALIEHFKDVETKIVFDLFGTWFLRKRRLSKKHASILNDKPKGVRICTILSHLIRKM